MTKCNTDQLLTPETEEYLKRRGTQLWNECANWELQIDLRVRAGESPDSANASLERLYSKVADNEARRNELWRMRNVLEEEETARRQKSLDEFEQSLAGEEADERNDAIRQRNAMKAMIEENEQARISDFMKLGFKDLQAHPTLKPKK